MQYSEEYLQHWGILGMKWGRRKAETSSPQNQGQSFTPRNRPSNRNRNRYRNHGGNRQNSIAKFDRAMDTATSTPFSKANNERYRTTFRNTVIGGIVTSVLIGVIGRMLGPTADKIGGKAAGLVFTQGAKIATKVATTQGPKIDAVKIAYMLNKFKRNTVAVKPLLTQSVGALTTYTTY